MIDNKWLSRHLQMAHEVAKWSKDPSTQVGARIAFGKVMVSEGYNGPPSGMQDDPAISREAKLRRTIHAEVNAILYAKRDLHGATIYVTHPPCATCAALIAQSGITEVVYTEPGNAFRSRWRDEINEAELILKACGITITTVQA